MDNTLEGILITFTLAIPLIIYFFSLMTLAFYESHWINSTRWKKVLSFLKYGIVLGSGILIFVTIVYSLADWAYGLFKIPTSPDLKFLFDNIGWQTYLAIILIYGAILFLAKLIPAEDP